MNMSKLSTGVVRRLVLRAAVCGGVGLLPALGCDGTGRQFREAALPGIEQGVDALVNGVLDGIFASIQVETPSDTTDSVAN